jgi:hypothetical protein
VIASGAETVALAGREFQKLPPLFALGLLRAVSSCEDGTYNEKAKPARGQSRSRP